jgi:DNA-binding transcriptional MerR regulator
MNKSPEAFRTISEVAEALDVPPHVLRFWETRFAQVKPVKRGGGRRYYRPEDVRLLRGIRGLLYDDGMTIKGVQKILRERGIRHVIGLGTTAEPEPEPAPLPETAPEPVAAAAELVAAVAPAAARARAAAAPQADLFETGSAHEAGTTAVVSGPKPLDKAALRSLVARLQALRAVMLAEPKA